MYCSGLNSNPGLYRSRLNTHIQKKLIKDNLDWEYDSTQKGHSATVVVELPDGRKITGRCRKMLSTKREAQEIAAKSVIDQMKQLQQQNQVPLCCFKYILPMLDE